MWEHTLSFFPQFLATLGEHASPGASVAVVGASDGKFVLPLAAAGYRVIAIERDPLALHGGQVRLPGDIAAQAPGLIARLEREGLRDWFRSSKGTSSPPPHPWRRATRSGRAARGTTV